MTTSVYCTFQFEALHCWPNAASVEPEVSYLAHPHRHVFHCEARWKVEHSDRDREFILAKQQCVKAVESLFGRDTSTWSCEQWAIELMGLVNADYVRVAEDGENGAIVER